MLADEEDKALGDDKKGAESLEGEGEEAEAEAQVEARTPVNLDQGEVLAWAAAAGESD
jgi:hypothetical protein